MKKNDIFILLFVFSLFFVDLIPLNVNLLNNTFNLSLNNLTSYLYIALSLYLLFNVVQYLKKNELNKKLVTMYTLGYLVSLFMIFNNFDINFINNTLRSSDVFILFFGRGNPDSALAIIFNILFSLVFLAATLGLYYLIVYPIYQLIKKVKPQIQFSNYLNIAFLSFVGSKALFVFFDFLINVTTLQPIVTTLTAFFLFMSWLLNVVAIVSLILIKIIVIVNIYLKVGDKLAE